MFLSTSSPPPQTQHKPMSKSWGIFFLHFEYLYPIILIDAPPTRDMFVFQYDKYAFSTLNFVLISQ